MPAEPVPVIGDHAEDADPAFAHVPGLDGLRGLAVAAVLAFHAGHLRGGYLGVDLFFVLSGYLITSLLLVEYQRDGSVDLRAFWGRRIRRLMPALFALLVGTAAYARWIARPIDVSAIRGDAFATLGYVANWQTIFNGSNYWDISRAPSPLQHTWSLAIEEQFYLVWPLVVWGLVVLVRRRVGGTDHRRLEALIAWVAIVGTVVAFALFVGLHELGMSTTRLYEGTDTRAGAIFGGVALAVWSKRRRTRQASLGSRPSAALEVVGIVAAIGLFTLWVTLDGQSEWLYRGMLPVASVLAVVVIGAVDDPGSPVLGRVFSFPVLRWLGLISYGLYLWHWPIFQALELRNGRYPMLGARTLTSGELLVAKLLLSLAVAVVSYVLIEQPMRHGRLPKPARIPAVAVSVVAVVALVLVTTRTEITGPNTTEVAVQANTKVDEAPTLMVLGDSVGASFVRPLIEAPAEFGINPVNKTYFGCSEVARGLEVVTFAGFELEHQSPPCGDNVTDAEIREIDPDIVYLEMGARPNDFLVVDGENIRACDPAYDALYRERIGELLDRLGAAGARVYMANMPHSSEFSIPVEGSEERIDCVNRTIAEVVDVRPFASVVDLDAFLCPEGPGSCREELDGDPIRSDGLHFDDGPGGVAISHWIVDQLLDAQ